MMAKSNAERQKEFHQKMLGQGNVRVVVYAPAARAAEIRAIAALLRDRVSNPDLFKGMQNALIEAKGALSASVDGNTKDAALKAVKTVLEKCRDYDEPI
jgi:hypothetical protein